MMASVYFIVLCFLMPWHGVSGKEWSSDILHRHQVPEQLRSALENTHFNQWSIYLPTEVDPNSTCGNALEEMKDAFSGDNITGAHKFIDSWGKRATGYMVGIPYYLGVYDECRNSVFGKDNHRGRYCKIRVRTEIVEEIPVVHQHFLPMWAPAEVRGAFIDTLNSTQTNGTVLTYSTCMPDACTSGDLKTSLMEVLNNSDYVVQEIDCHMDLTSDAFSGGDIAFITLLSVFTFTLLLASGVDIYIQKTKNKVLAKGGFRYLLPFSAYTNIDKLFHMNTESPPGTITCLHGIRVLSMTWVVCAHQQSIAFGYTSNIFSMFNKMNGIMYQALLNGFPSVDTFFFMSGFLMSYSVLREFQRSGRFNIVLFYFHRLLRLIPPMAVVSGLYATIVKYFEDGPLAPSWYYWQNNCQNFWWRDVFFVDNIIATGDHSCLEQCWYLAVDTQIYLIAPLILLPIMYKREFGMVWLYTITMISIIVPSAITYAHDLPPTLLLLDPKGTDEFNDIYIMPWCRAGPVLIGIWLGIFIQSQGKSRIKLTPWQVLAGWTVAAVTGLMVVFGLWSYNVYPRKVDYDVMTAALYSGFHRPAWAAALSWVIFACYNGYGGFVDDFLSHPIWQPMSRLTYSMYLVAMPLQYAIFYNTRSPYYFNHYTKVLETVGALIISVIPAILVSITTESPIIGIEKLLFRRPVRQENIRKQSKNLNGVGNEAFEEIKQLDGGKDITERENNPKETAVTYL